MNKIIFFEANIDEMGGVERVISTLANSLCDNYDIEVVSLYSTREKPFFRYDDKIRRIYLQKGLQSAKCKSKKLKYFICKVFEKIYRMTVINYKKTRISKRISENDVLIFGRLSMAVEWIGKYLYKNKNIIVRDASHYYCHNKYEQKEILSLLKNYIKLFIVSSDESKGVYEKLLSEHDCKIKKVYNPLGIEPKIKYNFESKKIIAVGRCDFQKGYNVLIKSFYFVHKKYSDWKLEIVGNYDEEMVNLIKELSLEKNIILTKESQNIVEKLNSSAIYVTASRFEGYANSLVEAVACGIPSITVNWLLGPNEIIRDKHNGIIVDLKSRFDYARGIDNEEDAVNLSKAIISLIENPNICKIYSANSQEILKTRDKNKIIKIWKQEIEEMLNNDN